MITKARKLILQVICLALGLPILVLGIVLIPLPGPGVLVTILGLFILSYGFDSVKQPLERYLGIIRRLYKRTKSRYDEFVDKHNLK